ncbi:MAG: tRNA pseudouridine(55) synthase TruB [Firmicutes bacterium]|jgi:tRNA pseudouridine55 synthase|nr:tRNA pseudouridine(55) synthase TruB [Bacillota bacterium]
MPDGFINILKPPGLTSHDVVVYVRRLLGLKRVGHSGTLDPLASGVLVVAVGRATRLIRYLRNDKVYRAEITFGRSTTTMDAAGRVVRDVPRPVGRQELENTLASFCGCISQIPPMVSAVHHQGKRLYELAREGLEVERKPRWVEVKRLDLLGFQGDNHYPKALIEVECSAGTYVRVLADDIGTELGCGAYLSFLLRTASGPFRVEASITLEELAAAVQDENWAWLISPQKALEQLPIIRLEPLAAKQFSNGQAVSLSDVEGQHLVPGSLCIVEEHQGVFLGVARCVERKYSVRLAQPEVVFN